MRYTLRLPSFVLAHVDRATACHAHNRSTLLQNAIGRMIRKKLPSAPESAPIPPSWDNRDDMKLVCFSVPETSVEALQMLHYGVPAATLLRVALYHELQRSRYKRTPVRPKPTLSASPHQLTIMTRVPTDMPPMMKEIAADLEYPSFRAWCDTVVRDFLRERPYRLKTFAWNVPEPEDTPRWTQLNVGVPYTTKQRIKREAVRQDTSVMVMLYTALTWWLEHRKNTATPYAKATRTPKAAADQAEPADAEAT